jgi:hypothetical protein
MGRAVVSTDTGEVLSDIRDGDRLRIIRKESIDSFKSREEWGEQFFKGYVAELRHVLPTLEQSEKSLLLSIAPYVSYFDCHLEYPNGRDMTFSGIVEATGYSKKTVIGILRSLVDKDIMYRGHNSKNNQWFVNPWLFSRGNTINKVLKAMFKNYYIRTKKCRWKDLFED